MQFRVGYELVYTFVQPTPMILVVNIHESRAADIVVPDRPTSDPPLPITSYRDAFGNQRHVKTPDVQVARRARRKTGDNGS